MMHDEQLFHQQTHMQMDKKNTLSEYPRSNWGESQQMLTFHINLYSLKASSFSMHHQTKYKKKILLTETQTFGSFGFVTLVSVISSLKQRISFFASFFYTA
jgi:hypothetical protein